MQTKSTPHSPPLIRVRRDELRVEGHSVPLAEDERLTIVEHTDWPIMFLSAGLSVVLLLMAVIAIFSGAPWYLYGPVLLLSLATFVGSLVGESRRPSYFELRVLQPSGQADAITISRTKEPLQRAIDELARARATQSVLEPAQVQELSVPGPASVVEQVFALPVNMQMRLARAVAAHSAAKLDRETRESFLRELQRDVVEGSYEAPDDDLHPGQH